MKNRLSKTLLFFLSACALMCIMAFSVSAKTVTSNSMKFDVKSNKATLIAYTGKATDVKIPSKVSGATVTAIGNEAFWRNKKIKTVTIPTTVTSIGIAAFNECSALTKVVIPYKVTKIGESAFWYCTNLKTVVVPYSAKTIGKNAFKGCSKATAYVTKGSYAEKYIKAQKDAKLGYRYVSSLSLASSTVTVSPGKTLKLNVKISPSVVYNKKLTYSSSNKKIVTVDSSGKIKGIACGKATITIKTADGSNLVKKCTVKVVPAQITKLTQSKVTTTSFTLSWSAVKGATHYKLYLYDSAAKKWNGLAITTKLSYKISGLKAGATNQYKIMAFAKINKTNYCGTASKSFKFSTAFPATVKNLTASPYGTNAVKLTWKKADHATGYKIYIYDAKTKTYLYQYTTSKLTTKVEGLFSGTKYGFAVRSYMKADGKTYNSKAYSSVVYSTTRPESATNLTVDTSASTANSITLKWKGVKDVAGYRVLMWDSKTNAYATVKNIYGEKITSYKVEKLAANTSYKFTLKTFVKDGSVATFGYNCNEVTASTLPARVTGLTVDTAKSTADSLTLKWDSVKGAAGYRVLMWNSKTNAFSTLKDITGEKATSYTAEKLAANTEYRFTVKTIFKNGTAPVLAQNSAEASATTLPACVTTLAVDSEASATDSLTLKWSAVKGVSGYRILVWDNKSNSFVTLKDINGENTVSYKVESLATNTEYKFTLRTFVKKGSDTVFGFNGNEVVASTLPRAVTSLTVDSEKTTVDSLTLKWDSVKGASGYRVLKWNSETNAFETLKDITGEANTSYKAEGLENNTEYKFTVKAFVTKGSYTVYSNSCDAVTASTLRKAETKEDLFGLFVEAYNNTKSAANITAFMSVQGSKDDINAPARDFYDPIVSSVFGASQQTHFFIDGKDSNGKALNDLLTPAGSPMALTFGQINEESFAYLPNGSGNDIIFSLASEDVNAEATSLIAPVIDWEKIAQENPGFVLTSCTYKGTKVSAKINANELLDHIELSIPVEVSFTLNGDPYSFSGTVTYDYMFIWPQN